MEATSATFIYALLDPRNAAVRYVGKTRNSLSIRLHAHCSNCRRETNHKANWLRQLFALNLTPQIVLLEETTTANWQGRERFWITHFKDDGADLTNSTDGGEDETIFAPDVLEKRGRKISAAKKGKPNLKKRGQRHSPESRAKMSKSHKGQLAWNKGLPLPVEQRARMSADQKGKPGRNKGSKFSDQARANIRAARIRDYSSGALVNPMTKEENRVKVWIGRRRAQAIRDAAGKPVQLPLGL